MASTQTRGLIFLDTAHPIVEKIFQEKLVPDAKREPLDVKLSDFDDVSYEIRVDRESEDIVKMKMNMKVLQDIQTTVKPMLRSKYGSYLKSEDRSSVSLEVDLRNVKGDPEKVARLIANLKHNALGAPLEAAFKALADGKASSLQPTVINYRKTEQIILVPASDRVNVIFSIDFEDDTDAALAEIFLQEFQGAKRSVPSAPNVLFSRDRPGELRGVKGLRKPDQEVGYIMFQVFSAHVTDNPEKIISHLLGLRGYLHYHIKAAKAQLHERMRTRVSNLMQLLNRARPQEEEKKKKAFRRL